MTDFTHLLNQSLFYYLIFYYLCVLVSGTFQVPDVKSVLAHSSCKCDVYMGILWLKNTKVQQRISQNIIEKFTHGVMERNIWAGRAGDTFGFECQSFLLTNA